MEKSSTDVEFVKTGILGLDEMLHGGFEPRSLVLVAGGPGTGKSVLGMQFLVQGIRESDENGMYITFEEGREHIIKHMARFGWDLEDLEQKKRLIFLEYPPHEVDRFISEGGIIEDMIKQYAIKRIVVDSVTSFLLIYDNDYKRRQAFLRTMEALKKWGATTLLTSEADFTPEGGIHTRYGIEFLCDGLIALHSIHHGDEVELALEVVKTRGAEHERRLVPVRITPQGMEVLSKKHLPKFER